MMLTDYEQFPGEFFSCAVKQHPPVWQSLFRIPCVSYAVFTCAGKYHVRTLEKGLAERFEKAPTIYGLIAITDGLPGFGEVDTTAAASQSSHGNGVKSML